MKKIVRNSVMLTLVLGLALSTFAQQRDGATQQKKQMKYEHREMLPDLTDAQKESMKTIRLKTMKATQPLKNELMEKKAHLTTLTTAEKADQKAINKQIDEISTLRASIQKMKAESHQEIRSLLTDEQRILFDARKGRMSQLKGGQGMRDCDGSGPHKMMRKGVHNQ